MKLYQNGSRTLSEKFGASIDYLGFSDPAHWPMVQASFREFARRRLQEDPEARPDPQLDQHLIAAVQNRPQPHLRAGGTDHAGPIGHALRQLLGIEPHHLMSEKQGGSGWTGDERLGWITSQLISVFEGEMANG